MGSSIETSGPDRSGPESGGTAGAPTALSDEEVLERARAAANGDTFQRLWRGDTSGYPSHSEGDMALCCLLAFWTGGDSNRMDRLFRQSGLMRGKWDEVHYADGRTHGEVTVERALQVTDERYEPSTAGESQDETASSGGTNSVATAGTVESVSESNSEATVNRSRAHLVERTRLLGQRAEEQAVQIKALESALEQQSSEKSADESLPDSNFGGLISIRQWLLGGFD